MTAKLIVALDVPSVSQIATVVDEIGDAATWFKVGLELFSAAGPRAFEPLQERSKCIFLDLKLHDIPNTVARAVASAARHGVHMLTVHAMGGRAMLRAAADAAAACGDAAPSIVAVTTLTSLDQHDLEDVGIARSLAENTMHLGRMAVESGADGLVCSVHEALAFRKALGSEPLLVTPGIRPAGSEVGDQKRVATPAAAVSAGSSFLVVGRPILDATDRRQAALSILKQMTAP